MIYRGREEVRGPELAVRAVVKRTAPKCCFEGSVRSVVPTTRHQQRRE
jgi:hypothetical protein